MFAGILLMRFLISFVAALFLSQAATAQDRGVWVQVEAQPTLGQAQERVRAYAAGFDDVAGFYLGTGWYGIVLGPYAPEDAEALLRRLRAEGRIPGDSYITTGDTFRQQYWPVGTGIDMTAQPLPEDAAIADPAPETATETAPETTTEPADPEPEAPVVVAVPDESQSEALASESLLSRPEKEQLQIALQWAGFYAGAIDGAYGRGTRSSMAAWQDANGHDATGVLTTRQRAELLSAYNAVLEGLDLVLVRDDAAGIEMQIPTGVVQFAAYEPPFARFDTRGDVPAQVLLISQQGDLNRLFGLYEIMQTLEIVPQDGPRERGDASFTLEGIGPRVHSYTWASLEDGEIKGFTLVWPAGDEERFSRLLAEMRASFARIPGTLDPAIAPPDEDQAVDLVSGLAIRQPQLTRSGFFLNSAGAVLTTAEAVAQCDHVTLDGGHPARITFTDAALGIAVLTPEDRLAPRGTAAFQTGVPRLQSEVAVAGYPYGPVLTQPALTFGTLADIRGLNGEEQVKRLSILAQPGDAGGPVFDNGGAVLGMLLPRVSVDGQILPEDVSFSLDAGEILTALAGAGIETATTDSLAYIAPETLTRQAAAMTVLVSCW